MKAIRKRNNVMVASRVWRKFVFISVVSMLGFFVLFVQGCKDKKPPSPLDVPQPPNPNPISPAVPAEPEPEPPPNPPGNLLINPGFEEGREGWFWMDWSEHWVGFDISDKIAHSGKKSALLKLDYGPGSPNVRIHGVVQTLKPNRFPEVASGWYRVENWKRGSPKQYMQFVVIVWGGHPSFKNYQVRYLLAGVTRPPQSMRNVKYIVPKDIKETPTQKEWVFFKADIALW